MDDNLISLGLEDKKEIDIWELLEKTEKEHGRIIEIDFHYPIYGIEKELGWKKA